MRFRKLKPWLYALLALGCGSTAVKAGLNYLSDDFKDRGELESMTLEEARGRGILVRELIVEPNEVSVGNRPIRFAQAWIEERSRPAHRLVWFPGEHKVGGWRLHVTLALREGLDAREFGLVTNRRDGSLRAGTICTQERCVFVLPLDRPDVAGLLLRVVSRNREGVESPHVQLVTAR